MATTEEELVQLLQGLQGPGAFEQEFPRGGGLPAAQTLQPAQPGIAPAPAPTPESVLGGQGVDLQLEPEPTRQKVGVGRRILGGLGDALQTFAAIRAGGQAGQGTFARSLERQEQTFQTQLTGVQGRNRQIKATRAGRVFTSERDALKRKQSLADTANEREFQAEQAKLDRAETQAANNIDRIDKLRTRAKALSDPNLLAKDDPMRATFANSIMSQVIPQGMKLVQDENGNFVLVPIAAQPKPFVAPFSPGGGAPAAQGPGQAQPQDAQQAEESDARIDVGGNRLTQLAENTPGLGRSTGGAFLVENPLIAGVPLRGKANLTAQGNKVAIENAFLAISLMQESYESSRAAGLTQQTLGAFGQGIAQKFPSVRGVAQTVLPTGKAATIHEMHRGTLAALMARPLSGTARAQWFAQLLEEVIPHFTDTEEVAGTFYQGFLNFMQNAKKLPWGSDVATSQRLYEEELFSVLGRHGGKIGVEIPNPPTGKALEEFNSRSAPISGSEQPEKTTAELVDEWLKQTGRK